MTEANTNPPSDKLAIFREKKNGKLSIMRVAHFLGTFLILGVWAKLSIENARIEPIDNNMFLIFLSLQGAKVTQRFVENKTPNV